MSVNNLHSLLNGRWFIHESYGKALLPSLFALINGKEAVTPEANKKPPVLLTMGRTGAPVAASGKAGGEQTEYVLIMDFKDPIYKYNQECGPQGTKSKMRILDMYRNDAACVGIVLDMDSGGGQVSGTPELYDYLVNFGKPVVAYTDGYMCSAAYYIAAAASHIVANKRADHIGSIGTMIHFVDVTGIYEAQGAKIITEYATKSTKKNRDFEDLLAGKPEAYIKNQLDPITDTFHADMKAVRPQLTDATLTGATWDANGALEQGLIDEIGTLRTAVDKVFELHAAQQSNNQNPINNMSKPHAKLQAVLGLSAPLALTDNGTYLNAEQLDAVETDLANTATQLEAANEAKTTAETSLATATATHTAANQATETAVDAILTAAGLEVTGTLPEKLTTIAAHQAVLNKLDGAPGAKVIVGAGTEEEAGATVVGGIDVGSALSNC